MLARLAAQPRREAHPHVRHILRSPSAPSLRARIVACCGRCESSRVLAMLAAASAGRAAAWRADAAECLGDARRGRGTQRRRRRRNDRLRRGAVVDAGRWPSAGERRNGLRDAASEAGRAARTACGSPRRSAATSSMLGFAAFAGIGGGPLARRRPWCPAPWCCPVARSSRPTRATSGLIQFDSTTSTAIIPVGVSDRMATRRSARRTASRSTALRRSSTTAGGTSNSGLIRAAFGIDAGITPSLGLTGGIEFGGTRPQAIGGPERSRVRRGRLVRLSVRR